MFLLVWRARSSLGCVVFVFEFARRPGTTVYTFGSSQTRAPGASGDADRDLERRSFMVSTSMSVACQRLAIGRSGAGVPRTYRITRTPRLTRLRNVLQAFLPRTASRCGGLVNSVMVAVGDRVGLYKTGQYSALPHDDSPSR